MAANPRAAAVAALVRQEQDGFSNLVLDAELKRQQLEGRDKAFASAIFYTVLEHQGTLDHILCQFLPKGLAKLDAPVREILRAALAQARYMQVPVSAAVNEAVKLTRTFKKIQRIRSGQRCAAQGVQLRPEHRKLQRRSGAAHGAWLCRAGCGGISAQKLPG